MFSSGVLLILASTRFGSRRRNLSNRWTLIQHDPLVEELFNKADVDVGHQDRFARRSAPLSLMQSKNFFRAGV